jgi:hypothetical protein
MQAVYSLAENCGSLGYWLNVPIPKLFVWIASINDLQETREKDRKKDEKKDG